MKNQQLEKTIQVLTDKGVKITDIYGVLNMTRGDFAYKRNKAKPGAQHKLAQRIVQTFPQYFREKEYEDLSESETFGLETEEHLYKKKYVEMLERSLEEVKKERDELIQANKALTEEVKANPPKTANQYFNRGLKKICKAAGFTEIVTITEHRGGKTIKREFPKYELVSSHTARRSFATNAYLAGIPIFEIMKFTGHKTMSTFLQYVRITDAETAVRYYDHKFFS